MKIFRFLLCTEITIFMVLLVWQTGKCNWGWVAVDAVFIVYYLYKLIDEKVMK